MKILNFYIFFSKFLLGQFNTDRIRHLNFQLLIQYLKILMNWQVVRKLIKNFTKKLYIHNLIIVNFKKTQKIQNFEKIMK